MGNETPTSPWGIYALFMLCTILSLSGLIWCVCCGTCVGRDTMRSIGLSRFVPSPYKQPLFMNRSREHWKQGDEESWEEEISMDVLDDGHQDSSVEYDYDFSDEDNDSDDNAAVPYTRKPR